MRAGDLRRKITIQTRVGSQDSNLQQVLAWSDLLTNVPADIQNLTASEQLLANSMESSQTHTIVVRYHPLLADSRAVAGMRATYAQKDGPLRIFELKGAENVDERNRTIDLIAAEGLTRG